MKRMLAAAVFAAAAAAAAHADSWMRAEIREVFSANRDHFVRVTPGDSWGDLQGFAGANKGRYATAEFFRRAEDGSYAPAAKVTLLNPVAPVEVFVSNAGHLAMLDNWHNRGYGTAVAIYAADGSLVKAYALADLFTAAEIEAFPHSVSSINWHDGPAYINQDQKTLYVMMKSGTDIVFGLETAKFAYCETRNGQYQCRDTNTDRRWRPYGENVPKR